MNAKRAADKSASTPWSVPLALAEIPEEGRQFNLVADETARAAVARIAGLRSLPRLEANLQVVRHGADGLHVQGEVSATVGQTCVVTLEPLDYEIREEVDVIFAPPGPSASGGDDEDDGADGAGLDEPEPLIGNEIDLGALATEFLILGIDPYPRKPGATFEAPTAKDDAGHPFAALAALKKGKGSQE